jgi:hypothetical protein
MGKKIYYTYNGIGFTGCLQIALIILKLLNVITWSWVWVLAPIWISCAVSLVMLIGILIILYFLNK